MIALLGRFLSRWGIAFQVRAWQARVFVHRVCRLVGVPKSKWGES